MEWWLPPKPRSVPEVESRRPLRSLWREDFDCQSPRSEPVVSWREERDSEREKSWLDSEWLDLDVPLRKWQSEMVMKDLSLDEEDQARQEYEKALQQGEVQVAYGRVMFLGPAAVGKTSLKHGLMNKPLPSAPESTIIADVSTVRPVSYEWAKAGNIGETFWKNVTSTDEIMEIAQLMAAVYCLNKNLDAAKHLISVIGSVVAAAATVVHVPVMVRKLTQPDMKEVKQLKTEKVEDIFQKAMHIAKHISTFEIKPKVWLNLWDCGGQPVFLELLPAFLTSRTMFLLLFDASKDLNNNCNVLQFHQGKRKELGDENMSTLDLILQWMATTYAHLARLDDNKCLLDYPRLIPIGTHGDKVDDEEAVKKSLTDAFESAAFSSIVLPPLIVDNTKAGRDHEEDEAFQVIRKEIHSLTSTKLAVKIPVSWVLFRKVLQKLEQKALPMSEVCKIGVACEIPVEVVPKVLTFYHELGVLLFYGHIKSLQEVVVVSPKWLVEQLGNLLTLPGEKVCGDSSMWSLLQKKGILLESLFQKVWKNNQHLKPSSMMDLLIQFRLAAPIPCTEQHPLSSTVKEFFLPMMTELFRGDPSILKSKGNKKAASLYIVFNMGFVPPGFFTRLIATLSMYKDGVISDLTVVHEYHSARKGDFKILFDKEIFRNRVTLLSQKSPVDEITLTGSSQSIQVDMVRCVPDHNGLLPFHDSCCELLSAIERCSLHVSEVLYGKMGSVGRATTITSQLAMKCTSPACASAKVHYCKFEPSHPVSCDLRCSHGEYHLATEEEQYWLSPAGPLENSTMVEMDDTEIMKIAEKIGEFHSLAAHFNMTSDLERIKADYPHNCLQQGFWFLKKWYLNDGKRSELAQALIDLGCKTLANQVLTGAFVKSQKASRQHYKSTSKETVNPDLPTDENSKPTVQAPPATIAQAPSYYNTVAADMDTSPTIGDLICCSRGIRGDADLSLMAVALDVPDDDFDGIQQKYKNPQGQALQLMKIWLKNSGGLSSRRELADLLMNADLGKEAVDSLCRTKVLSEK